MLESEDPTAGGLAIYKTQSLFGPATSRSNDHPGFEAVGGLVTGNSVGFNVLGPLWYAGPTPPTLSPVPLTITPQDGAIVGSVQVDGGTGFQSGFLVGVFDGTSLGDFEHQLNYSFDAPGGVPVGAYAVALQLTGTGQAGPFIPSAPFVAVFNNQMSLNDFNATAPALYAAAIAGVPEPSSLVLGALGCLGAVGFALRRARRQVNARG